MQGVGPCQLTWWEFQDTVDREGGDRGELVEKITRRLSHVRSRRTGPTWTAPGADSTPRPRPP
jgi:hypothetical protein